MKPHLGGITDQIVQPPRLTYERTETQRVSTILPWVTKLADGKAQLRPPTSEGPTVRYLQSATMPAPARCLPWALLLKDEVY